LPFAVLGALLALVVAAALPSSGPGTATAASHASVGSGHVTDGLLATAHVRTVTHLPAAMPAGTPSTSAGPPAPSAATAPPSLHPLAATPPTAIRGPPA
jgi:hypothetical protein